MHIDENSPLPARLIAIIGGGVISGIVLIPALLMLAFAAVCAWAIFAGMTNIG